MTLNLYSFVDNPFTTKAIFNYSKFHDIVYEAQRQMDNLVDLEIEAIDRILAKIESDPEPQRIKQIEIDTWEALKDKGLKGRRTGLGFTALADTLAALGLRYDSNEALQIVDDIMREKMRAELDCTIDLAILRGAFYGCNINEEYRRKSTPEGIELWDIFGSNDFYKFIKENFFTQFRRMYKYGRRNVSFSTVAPTGSVSIQTQTSSGLEPLFQPFYTRRKKINPDDKHNRVDFVDGLGDKWQEYAVLHPKFKDWLFLHFNWNPNELEYVDNLSKEELQKYFEQSPWYGSTANDIDWTNRVKLQSTIQKYITHSISSTINLPSDVSVKEVSDIYIEAWRYGLKGVTVYREGSRSGVLVTNTDKKEEFPKNVAPKRPKKLSAKVLRFMNNKEKWIAFIGLYNDHPYEIFTGLIEGLEIPHNVSNGFISKNKDNGESKFYFSWEDGEIEISNAFDPIYWNYAKLISGILRHGMSLPNLISLINGLKLDDSSLLTWKHGVIRALKQFVKDGVETDEKCPECGSKLIYEEGCKKCSCGYSKCG